MGPELEIGFWLNLKDADEETDASYVDRLENCGCARSVSGRGRWLYNVPGGTTLKPTRHWRRTGYDGDNVMLRRS